MMPHMCTFNIRHPVLLSDVIIIIVTTVMHIKQLVTRTKHSKYTFATLLKHCLPRNWIHYIFGWSYCVSVRRPFCYNKSTVSNKPFSSSVLFPCTRKFIRIWWSIWTLILMNDRFNMVFATTEVIWKWRQYGSNFIAVFPLSPLPLVIC